MWNELKFIKVFVRGWKPRSVVMPKMVLPGIICAVGEAAFSVSFIRQRSMN